KRPAPPAVRRSRRTPSLCRSCRPSPALRSRRSSPWPRPWRCPPSPTTARRATTIELLLPTERGGVASQDLRGFLEVEAGRAGEQVLVRAVAQVHDEVRLDIAVGEELGLHARGVEARHRPHVQTQSPRGDGQIAALQRGVAEGGLAAAG